MLSFGSDPEFMLVRDGRYFSAIEIIQGSIDNRINIKGHQFYWDNVLAECAVRPAIGSQKFIESLKECFDIFSKMVHPYKLKIQASQEYPDSELQSAEARIAGCKPDFCAYELKQVMPPTIEIESQSLRTCGGHIHLGSNKGALVSDGYEPIVIVYLLDLFVGIPSLFLDQDKTSYNRRELYGQAGRYRVKSYGLEYRSLSNFWLTSPKLVKLIYNLCEFVVKFVEEGKSEELWEFDEEIFFNSDDLSKAFTCKSYNAKEIKKIIDHSDLKKASKYMTYIKKFLPIKIYNEIEKLSNIQHHEFYEEWNLNP